MLSEGGLAVLGSAGHVDAAMMSGIVSHITCTTAIAAPLMHRLRPAEIAEALPVVALRKGIWLQRLLVRSSACHGRLAGGQLAAAEVLDVSLDVAGASSRSRRLKIPRLIRPIKLILLSNISLAVIQNIVKHFFCGSIFMNILNINIL